MQFLAHRGFWTEALERNRPESLARAIAEGFGIETDLRDATEQLVIAHDVPRGSPQTVEDFLQDYRRRNSEAPLALNIKADGLRALLKPLLARYAVANYFCFDMSIPETLAYRREGLRFFTRESEYEPAPALYTDAAGVWMDMFHSDWITAVAIARHLDASKEVALVSPELHGRPHLAFWAHLRETRIHTRPGLMLCTDFPLAAREFFHD